MPKLRYLERIESLEDVQEYVRQLSMHRTEASRVKAQLKAMVEEIEAEATALEERLGPQVQVLVRQHLKPGKKSHKTAFGTVQFTTRAPSVSIEDHRAGMDWMASNLTPEVAVGLSRVDPKAFNSRFKVVEPDAGTDILSDDLYSLRDEETGELLPVEGWLAVKPTTTSMSIRYEKEAE